MAAETPPRRHRAHTSLHWNRLCLFGLGGGLALFAAVLLPLCFRPSSFDGFASSQADFVKDLYVGESLSWYMFITLLIFTCFLFTFRGVLFLFIWILGFDCWLLPNLFNEALSLVDMFKPVFSFERTKAGQLPYRIGIAVAFFSFCYWQVTQPSEFDGFNQAQVDVIKDLYEGILLSDLSQKEKEKIDKAKMPPMDDLLKKLDSEEYIDLLDPGLDEFDTLPENTAKRVVEEPVSSFSADVDTASYSYVRRMLNQERLPQPDAVRAEEMINYFDYDYPSPRTQYEPFNATVAVSDSPWAQGRKLIHIGIKGYDMMPFEKRFSNLVFLIDVSGSMHGDDRLPLVKDSIELLLTSLDPEDYVSIVSYSHEARVELTPTPARNKKAISNRLRQLHASGGTGGAGGLELAYQVAERNFDRNAVNRILLATDGDFNVGPTNNDLLKKFIELKRDKGIYLSVLGFGMGNYKDTRMKALANHGNGIAMYIDTLNEARKVLIDEAQSTIFPIANDVKIQVEFNPAAVSEYRLIGYEKRSLNREDFNNDKVDAGDVGSGHTVTAIYEINPKGSKASMLDELRYSRHTKDTPHHRGDGHAAGKGDNEEYAFLKIRYKLPDETESKLLTMPIAAGNSIRAYGGRERAMPEAPDFVDAKDAILPERILSADAAASEQQQLAHIRGEFGFATAVAGFAQILKGGKHSGTFGYDDVISLAERNRGTDEHGYRAEFIELVRRAEELAESASVW